MLCWRPPLVTAQARCCEAARGCGVRTCQAIQWALRIVRPFTGLAEIPNAIATNVQLMCSDPDRLLRERETLFNFNYWHRRALEVLPQTDQLSQQSSDPWLRYLLRGARNHKRSFSRSVSERQWQYMRDHSFPRMGLNDALRCSLARSGGRRCVRAPPRTHQGLEESGHGHLHG